MYSLIIDTATKFLYLALLKDEVVLEEIIIEGKNNHASQSVYQLDLLLKRHQVTPQDLNTVVCGQGPGSYTGVRIAVCIAKMLCSFTNATLKSVSSLYLMASGYQAAVCAPMLDARRGNFFCAAYGELEMIEKLRDKEEFLSLLEGQQVKYVYEDDFLVNPFTVLQNAKEVLAVDAFVPNYLRITEAEYNLEYAHDQKSE